MFPAIHPDRQSKRPPDRWALNRRAKAPLHFIYRPGELISLERADAERGRLNERRDIYAGDESLKSGRWHEIPPVLPFPQEKDTRVPLIRSWQKEAGGDFESEIDASRLWPPGGYIPC